MKNIYTISLFVIALLFGACEKVVKLDLQTANQQLVVQANINDQPGPYRINLNYSVPYYSDNSFPAASGALVKISDNAGNNETLTETSPGIYKTSAFVGVPGRTYNLQIQANGQSYSASSNMAFPVAIDSFLIHPNLGKYSMQITGYRVTCKFSDPAGAGNYYRAVISSNDTAAISSRNSRIVSDKLTDGTQLSVTFNTKLLSGDTVSVQLQCIDKYTYDFYNTLSNAVGSTGASQFLSALPANPTNNISNKGLGYFSAYSVRTQSLIVP